jgi:26S proteasome regulatory subunit N1
MIRKAVPLAIGLLYASNPQLTVFETLSRYSHDSNLEVAENAIFAMGLVGAGTNNARLAQLLRGLASYYHREPNCLFVVRVAQGMLHLAKGTMTLTPYHTDRQVLSRVSIAGLLPVLVSMMDAHHCTSPQSIVSNHSHPGELPLATILSDFGNEAPPSHYS